MIGIKCPHCGEQNEFQLETDLYYDDVVHAQCEDCDKYFKFKWEVVVDDPEVSNEEDFREYEIRTSS